MKAILFQDIRCSSSNLANFAGSGRTKWHSVPNSSDLISSMMLKVYNYERDKPFRHISRQAMNNIMVKYG